MEEKPKEADNAQHSDDATIRRFAKEVAADVDYEKRTWGGIDENLLAAYASGVCTDEEKVKVEEAMKRYPAVRESIEVAQSMMADPRSWTDRADRSGDKPGRNP